jgi:ElaB/YqjD/DUF883 family membrane-anchored ribosome-binding protein
MLGTNGEAEMKNTTNKAQERIEGEYVQKGRDQYERLEKDVAAVQNDIAALADQITDVLNSFAGTAQKQARRGYKQARANVDTAMDDIAERSGAAMDAAMSIEESIEDVITQRPLATVGLALGLGFLIGAAWRR